MEWYSVSRAIYIVEGGFGQCSVVACENVAVCFRQAEPGVLQYTVQAVRVCVPGLPGESGCHQGKRTKSTSVHCARRLGCPFLCIFVT